jgi:glycosyltransferase involved in cell wall biosynthesis
MATPVLSIVIPTRDRPQLLQRAVRSALAQTIEACEVIVVDDGSATSIVLPEDGRLRLIRLPASRGSSAARNAGLRAARGTFVAFLDDDEVLPEMAAISLAAIETSTLPRPVAALSGLEVVHADGGTPWLRLPPTLPKGRHFALEDPQPGTSFLCKQTLVAPRDVVRSIGGFDEANRSRELTDLLLRVNPVCSLQGTPVVTYRQYNHRGPRLSHNPSFNQDSFARLVARHRALFEAHPRGHARFLVEHALMLQAYGLRREAFAQLLAAGRRAPRTTLGLLGWRMRAGWTGIARRYPVAHLLARRSFKLHS